MALTNLAIKAFKPKTALYRVADSGGLCLEITPAGGKLWRWRYRYNGKAQLMALGKWPDVGLQEARTRRDEAKAKLTLGKHPAREKKAEKLKAALNGQNTFERAARDWLGLKRKNLNEKYAKQTLTRMEQHIFPHIGALPLSDITIPDVVRVIEKISNRGTIETAHRMKQVISQVFRYSVQRGLCASNPAADMRDVLPSAPERHHACIKPAELPEFLAAMESYSGDRKTCHAMRLIMLTFVRTRELIGAKWNEIDFDRSEWVIPAARMKVKRHDHLVPLSRQAVSILKDLKNEAKGDYVFHNASSKSGHMSNGALLMALRRMGYQGRMTVHGFRTLASTILNERGYNKDVIERQLSHEDEDKIRSAYNRAEYILERKKLMQDYADLLDEVSKNKGKNIKYLRANMGKV